MKGKDLKGKIVVPQELLDEMDELRLLDNDAAHIETKAFESITKPEIDIVIEFITEKLKSLYQYAPLLERLVRSNISNADHQNIYSLWLLNCRYSPA